MKILKKNNSSTKFNEFFDKFIIDESAIHFGYDDSDITLKNFLNEVIKINSSNKIDLSFFDDLVLYESSTKFPRFSKLANKIINAKNEEKIEINEILDLVPKTWKYYTFFKNSDRKTHIKVFKFDFSSKNEVKEFLQKALYVNDPTTNEIQTFIGNFHTCEGLTKTFNDVTYILIQKNTKMVVLHELYHYFQSCIDDLIIKNSYEISEYDKKQISYILDEKEIIPQIVVNLRNQLKTIYQKYFKKLKTYKEFLDDVSNEIRKDPIYFLQTSLFAKEFIREFGENGALTTLCCIASKDEELFKSMLNALKEIK